MVRNHLCPRDLPRAMNKQRVHLAIRLIMLVGVMSDLIAFTSQGFANPNTLSNVINLGLAKQSSIKVKRFELQGAQQGLKAAQDLFGLQFNGTLDLSDDLVTIPNPLEMGRRTAIETQRYGAELGVSQALKWGTVLGFGLRQSQIQTTNPFRNCVPGIISEQCYESSLTLRLNQSLLRGSSAQANTSELQSARHELRLKEIQIHLESQREIKNIATLYLQLSLAEAQYALEKKQLALIERQLAEARERIKLGVLAPSEVFSLQAAKAQKKQGVARVKGNELEARLLLSQKVEQDITDVIYPDDWFSVARINEVLHYPKVRSWVQSLQYKALSLSTRQLETRLFPLEDAQKPQLNLGLVWSQSGLGEALSDSIQALPDNESRFYGISLSYTQTLSDRAEAQSAQLKAQIQAQQSSEGKLEEDLQQTWTRLRNQLILKKELLDLSKEAQVASQRSAEATEERFKAGRSTLFEVLEQQNQAFAAQTQIVIMKHDLAQVLIDIWALNDELLERFGLEIKVGLNE
ncbi:MAG: hypothetical protein CMH49_02730 [Myxococcales bacterium]|nr:hypothetical protein [Myxococcales bacterium]